MEHVQGWRGREAGGEAWWEVQEEGFIREEHEIKDRDDIFQDMDLAEVTGEGFREEQVTESITKQ